MKIGKWAAWTLVAVLGLVFAGLGAARGAAWWRETHSTAVKPDGGANIRAGDLDIFVQTSGPANGVPLLLVHGTAAWSGFWHDAATRLGEAGFRAIAVDMPPFGFSGRSAEGRYSREDQARRLAAVIANMQLRNAIVIGHSFGAGAAVELAMRHPDAIGGLVIVSGALSLPEPGQDYPPDNSLLRAALGNPIASETLTASVVVNPLLTRKLLASLLYKTEAATQAQADILILPQSLPGTTQAYAKWLPFLLFPDSGAMSANPANYAAIKAPTIIIWGANDSVTPVMQGRRLHAMIGNASMDIMDSTGHIPHIENPGPFLDLLIKRLRSQAFARAD